MSRNYEEIFQDIFYTFTRNSLFLIFKRSFSILLLSLLSLVLHAQKDSTGTSKPKKDSGKKAFDWSRVTLGGNAGGGTTSGGTTILLAPTIGYHVTEKFVAGVGFKYIYFKDRIYNYSTNIYGGNIFGRYFLTDFLFAHAEYEVLNGEFDPFVKRRININNVWVGGGLCQRFGAHSYAMVGALWNLNESAYSFPLSPQIVGGVVFGL